MELALMHIGKKSQIRVDTFGSGMRLKKELADNFEEEYIAYLDNLPSKTKKKQRLIYRIGAVLDFVEVLIEDEEEWTMKMSLLYFHPDNLESTPDFEHQATTRSLLARTAVSSSDLSHRKTEDPY